MKSKEGFIQSYNAQAAGPGASGDPRHGLTAKVSDQGQLVPLVDAVKANTGRKPREVSADSGYCSEANLEALESRRIRAYIATGRQKHPDGGEDKKCGPGVEAMQRRLRRAGHHSRYRLRKQIVEPVFGQIKQPPPNLMVWMPPPGGVVICNVDLN